MSSAVSIIHDRNHGTMERSMVAGATKSDFVIGCFVTEGVAIIIQSFFSYGVALYIIDGNIVGSHLTLISIIALTGAVGLCCSKNSSYKLMKEIIPPQLKRTCALNNY
jgi:hypothetical protein